MISAIQRKRHRHFNVRCNLYFMAFSLALLTLACHPTIEKNKPVKQFALEEVQLLEGPFLHATELNQKQLLAYVPDRFLAKFRIEAGLKPKAEHYHGWEDDTIAGHSLGHYLSGCALMYQTSRDSIYLARVRYIVEELDEVQNAQGDGYLGAIPGGKRIFMDEISKGNIRPQSFDLNGMWAPFYSQHKILAGLRDAYRLCGIPKALEVEKNFVDWIETIISPLSEMQIQNMLRCEHGGINEVLADLYADTQDPRYLQLSHIFHHRAILDSLSNQKDILPGIHANTQIPKLIGLARRFELTGDSADYKASTFFWDRVVHHHSYVTGGHGNFEYFGKADKLRNRLSEGTTETCNVYNMLKLSSHIMQWHPDADVADFYERALFNHILASQHPESGRVIYNLSLEMGGNKEYQNPEWFTCCVGSAMETHSKYGENIYYSNEEEIYVSQFISSVVKWSQKGVDIKQLSRFPEEQGSTLIIECGQPTKFSLKLRYPTWALQGMQIYLNSKPIKHSNKPGSFVSIDRTWQTGDTVRIDFPFSLRTERMPDDSNRIAFFYGPILLVGDLGPVQKGNDPETVIVPVLFSETGNPTQNIKQTGINHFETFDLAKPQELVLRPFYKVHDRHYSVYFDIYNASQWEQHQQMLKDKLTAIDLLELNSYDVFKLGEVDFEKAHNLKGKDIYTEHHKNRKARGCNRGGWFSFDMKVIRNQPMRLVNEYWGGYTGTRTFDILIDKQIIGTENISGLRDGEFINVDYEIPDSLTKDKDLITVLFQPHEGNRAGPVFTVRTVKR